MSYSSTSSLNERLLAYYLGSIDEESRKQVEEELLESKVALMNFIALKRSFECLEFNGLAPSLKAKKRLLSEVQRTFGQRTTRSFQESKTAFRWKPAIAAAALLIIVLGGVSLFQKHDANFSGEIETNSNSVRMSEATVDFSNDVAASLSVL